MALRALVTGVTGQDGYYLARLLHSKGYEVYGGYRRNSADGVISRVRPYLAGCIPLELTEYETIKRAIKRVEPDEIYNLGAQSHVGESFNCPLYTADVNLRGVIRLLEAVRESPVKVYQASTSEMFGGGLRLNEQSPFAPHSPYAVAKLAAHHTCGVYRQSYGTRVSCGILFNHESPLRGREFVTQKIVCNLVDGTDFTLGNVDARRDWGHAEDYVEAMWMMLQSDPDDYVVATGKSFSVATFLYGVKEDIESRGMRVNVTPTYKDFEKRPWDVDILEGDPTKIKEKLGWEPKHDCFSLIEDMVNARIRTGAEAGSPPQL